MGRMIHLSRRGFLGALSALGASAFLAGCGVGGVTGAQRLDRTVMYRLSTKGQRASRAAKSNAANKRFATPEAALAGRAHDGDNARVVRLDTSPDTWERYFQGGARLAVDLRRI